MNDDTQAELLKHLATISTGASVVVVALRSELDSGVVALSVALLFLSLLISVGGLAWRALFYGLLGEEGATHREIGVISILAYLFFIVGALVLVGSLLLKKVLPTFAAARELYSSPRRHSLQQSPGI